MSLRNEVERSGIAWVEGYLDNREAEAVADGLKSVFWRRSEVVRRGVGGDLESFSSDTRTSEGAAQRWFSPKLKKRVDVIQARLCQDFGIDPAFLEPWQAIRYHPGARFGIHHDAGLFGDEAGGERVLTFLLCLKAPSEGGATYFPDLNLLVDAVVGRLLVWKNLLPDGSIDATKRHAATPPYSGRKIVLTTWARQRPVHSSS